MLAAELNPYFRTCIVFVVLSATDMLIRFLRFHILFSLEIRNPRTALLRACSLRMFWEWISATVQAIRWHLQMEINRGGPVAAISLCSACNVQHVSQESTLLCSLV